LSAARHGETWDLAPDGFLLRVFFLDFLNGDWSLRTSPPPSPGAQQAALEPPRAIRTQPESIQTFTQKKHFVIFDFIFWFSIFSPKFPKLSTTPVLVTSQIFGTRLFRLLTDCSRTARGPYRPMWEI